MESCSLQTGSPVTQPLPSNSATFGCATKGEPSSPLCICPPKQHPLYCLQSISTCLYHLLVFVTVLLSSVQAVTHEHCLVVLSNINMAHNAVHLNAQSLWWWQCTTSGTGSLFPHMEYRSLPVPLWRQLNLKQVCLPDNVVSWCFEPS